MQPRIGNFQTLLMIQAVLSAALISAGCANKKSDPDNGQSQGTNTESTDKPSPPDQKQSQGEKQQQTFQVEQQKKAGSSVTELDRQIAKVPPPVASTPEAQRVARAIDAQDNTTILFTRML